MEDGEAWVRNYEEASEGTWRVQRPAQPRGGGGGARPGVSAEGLLWDLSEMCFSLAPNYLEAFWLVWIITKKIKKVISMTKWCMCF